MACIFVSISSGNLDIFMVLHMTQRICHDLVVRNVQICIACVRAVLKLHRN